MPCNVNTINMAGVLANHRSFEAPRSENLARSVHLILRTAERCCGGLQDFVGQRRIVNRPRENHGSDKPRHCRQSLFPPRGDRLGRHETAQCVNQGLEAFRNGAPHGSWLTHNIGPDGGKKAPVRPITPMLR